MKDEVEFRYFLSKYSHDILLVFDLLYGIYGTFAFVLIYKLLKKGRI